MYCKRTRYKSCIHCFALIRNALAANFVNLGVMTLYHDDSVETALVSFLQLMSSIPTTDLVSIPKLTKNFFSALDYFLQDLTSYLFVMPVTLYISVLGCVEEGLKHIDRDVRDLCCRIVENITGYVHRHMSREKPSTDRSQIEQLLAQAPQALPHVLELILNMIFYDTDRGCHMLWRPLLGLILLFEKEYVQIRDLLIESSPPARVHIARAAFEKLMADIEPDLTLRTKDRFNANLQHMRAALRQGVSVRDATAFGTTIVSSPLEGLGMFDGGTMQAQQHVHLLHNAEYGTNAQASPRFYQGAGATTMS
ncbi:hypothetical protein CAOG_009330 [Capsaspora owczarzaki ATCC 30864]|uniref:Uncharacterized protein n=1 Tax=Capsaspora owczarzaki (strain ATCC 30864) TaxID=595528 RepID=A0A0D2WHR6_CAPO3|nr:hypothetical protein CAOG_009330 [Capsaspora owczarzaki ATCC 30864]